MKRRRAYRRGLRGERLAGLILRFKGYRILARRYRTPVGEIDVIAKRGATVAFVEVKARASARMRKPGLAAAVEPIVTRGMESRIMNASDCWLARHPDAADLNLRYDLIYVLPWRLPRHIPNAFSPR